MSKMYEELAWWWPLLSPPAEYAEEAAFYGQALAAAADAPIRSVLELGSGGGHNASHMKKAFGPMVLVEPSDAMRALSAALNPDCEHVKGDMRSVRLHRQFDAVFVHDAVCYMLTTDDLRQAIETAFVHCRPGGVALFAPDHVRENFAPGTDHGGHDADADLYPAETGSPASPDPRAGHAMRYLEWTWDPDPNDATYTVDYTFMLRTPDGNVRVEHDRHTEGLFARAEWLRLLSEAGFEAKVVPLQHSEVEEGAHEVFVVKRPAS
jgi:SAM-dependent methyltransferase